MGAELLPMSPAAAAHRVGVSIDELVRWCVLADRVPTGWTFDPGALDALALDAGWIRLQPDPAPATPDDQLRAAVTALLDGAHRDGDAVRADALWRGLSAPHAALLEAGVERLLGAGLLLRAPGIEPLHVSVPREAERKLRRLADGSTTLDVLLPT